MNFAKLFRTPFITEHLQWLLLNQEENTNRSRNKGLTQINLPHKTQTLNRFPEITFILYTTASLAKELACVYENYATCEISGSQHEEGPFSNGKELSRELKDYSNFFLCLQISENCFEV